MPRLPFVLASALLLSAFPAAASDSMLPHPSCDNHGVIVQVGASNAFRCSPQDGSCTNHGVAVTVGLHGSSECEGACANEGVVVGVQSGYCREGSGACLASSCLWVRCDGHQCRAEVPPAPSGGFPQQ